MTATAESRLEAASIVLPVSEVAEWLGDEDLAAALSQQRVSSLPAASQQSIADQVCEHVEVQALDTTLTLSVVTFGEQ